MAFVKGKSGNPRGRPKGSGNQLGRELREKLSVRADELLDKAINVALAGDVPTLKFLLERLMPAIDTDYDTSRIEVLFVPPPEKPKEVESTPKPKAREFQIPQYRGTN